MMEIRSREDRCPEDVLGLIPWYPDGPLSDVERGAVETHAAACAECRDEIHALLGGLGRPVDVDVPPAARVLARVLDRIDAEEAAGVKRRRAPAAFRRSAGSRRWALAASVALAACTGAVAAITLPRFLGESAYTTAAAPQVARNSGPLVEMIPREDVSAGELRTALRRIEGELVGGPEGTLGRYRVRLPAGADAAAAAALLRAKEGGIATYAEPLHL